MKWRNTLLFSPKGYLCQPVGPGYLKNERWVRYTISRSWALLSCFF